MELINDLSLENPQNTSHLLPMNPQKLRRIDESDLLSQKEIKRGGQGIIYLVELKTTDEEGMQERMIVKIPLGNSQHPIIQTAISKELYILKNIQHPHVLGLSGEIYHDQILLGDWIVLPYMEKGALDNKLLQTLSWRQRLQISQDITSGLSCLHHHQILHRDIKAENILIDRNDRAKLADFGTVRLPSELQMTFVGENLVPVVGTVSYFSPELARHSRSQGDAPYSEASDVFALGVVFCEMASQRTAQVLILQEGFIRVPKDAPKIYRQWIAECLKKESKQRPEASQLFDWLSDFRLQQQILDEVENHLATTKIIRDENWPSGQTLLQAMAEVLPSGEALFFFKTKLVLKDSLFFTVEVISELQQGFEETLLFLQNNLLLLQNPNTVFDQQSWEKWQTELDCLFKNPNYWPQYTIKQRQSLVMLLCDYGVWVSMRPDLPELILLHWQTLKPLMQQKIQQQEKTAPILAFGLALAQVFGVLAHGGVQDWAQAFGEGVFYLHQARQVNQSNQISPINEINPQTLNEQTVDDRLLGYLETVLTLAFLTQTLADTLTSETNTSCRFYEVARLWLALLCQAQGQFNHEFDNEFSTHALIQATWPKLLSAQTQGINQLLPRVHKHLAWLAKQAKDVSDTELVDVMEKTVWPWLQQYQQLGQMDWMLALHEQVIKPVLTQQLEQARWVDVKTFEKAVAEWVVPWIRRYVAVGFYEHGLIYLVKVAAIAPQSKAQGFDTQAFAKLFEPKFESNQKPSETPQKITAPKKQPGFYVRNFWCALNDKRRSFYTQESNISLEFRAEQYSRQVIGELQSAIELYLPLLGEAPANTKWSLIGLGSVGRLQLLPFSDIDVAILVEDDKVRESGYWLRLLQFIKTLTQMMDVTAEIDPEGQVHWRGHHLDSSDEKAMRPPNPVLVQTPSGFAAWVVKTLHQGIDGPSSNEQLSNDWGEQQLAYSGLHTVLMVGEATLFSNYQWTLQRELKQTVSKRSELVKTWQKRHDQDWQKSLKMDELQYSINLKDSLFAPLNYYWLDNGLRLITNKPLSMTKDIQLGLQQQFQESPGFRYWLGALQGAWQQALHLRQQLEIKAGGRISCLQPDPNQGVKLIKLNIYEQGLVLTKDQAQIISQLQSIVALAYHALRQNDEGLNSLVSKLSTNKPYPDFLPSWEQGLVALLAYSEHTPEVLQLHRDLYRGLNTAARRHYDEALQQFNLKHPNASEASRRLQDQILPQIPESNGNRLGFMKRQQVWRETVQSLIEPLPNNTEVATGIVVSWMIGYRRYEGLLKTSISQQCLTESGIFDSKKTLPDCQRPVVAIRETSNEQYENIVVYAKAYPEWPGRQIAADLLSYRISGTAVQTTLVLFTPIKNGKRDGKAAYPVLLSQSAGKTVQEICLEDLKQEKQEDRKNQEMVPLEQRVLDPYHFTLKVFVTYMLGYEDDKKDNVTLTEGTDALGQPCLQLVSIDSDHAFFSPMVKDTLDSKVQVKSVTLFFPAMEGMLDKNTILDFLSLDRYEVLTQWLSDCKQAHYQLVGNPAQKQAGLFSIEQMARLAPINQGISLFSTPRFSFIPIAFEPGTIANIYQRWLRLERTLKGLVGEYTGFLTQPIPINHFQLLSQVAPQFSHIYQTIFEEGKTVNERFDLLAKRCTDYEIIEVKDQNKPIGENQQQITRHVSTMKNVIHIEKTLVGINKFKDALLQNKIFIANEDTGFKELEFAQGHYRYFDELKKVFAVGINLDKKDHDKAIKTLNNLFAKNYYLTLIERVLSSMRFEYTEENKARIIQWQGQLLTVLSQHPVQELVFNGWHGLTEERLLTLINNHANLQKLIIIDCPNFRCSGLTFAKLATQCPQLTELRLSGLEEMPLSKWIDTFSLPETVSFPNLQLLQLENCNALVSYQLNAPNLQQLTLENCYKLIRINLSAQPIQRLNLWQCPLLTDSEILSNIQGQHLQKLAVESCDNLKFVDSYQKWPWLIGQLGAFYENDLMIAIIEELKNLTEKSPVEYRFPAETIVRFFEQWRNNKRILLEYERRIFDALVSFSHTDNDSVLIISLDGFAAIYPYIKNENHKKDIKDLLTKQVEFYSKFITLKSKISEPEAMILLGEHAETIRKSRVKIFLPCLNLDEYKEGLLNLFITILDGFELDLRIHSIKQLEILFLYLTKQEQKDQVIEKLLIVSMDWNLTVRTNAIRVLQILLSSVRNKQQRNKILELLRKKEINIYNRYSKIPLEYYLSELSNKYSDARENAVHELRILFPHLGENKLEDVSKILLFNIKNKKWYVRASAAQALCSLFPFLKMESQKKLVLEELLGLFKDDCFDVSRTAVEAFVTLIQGIEFAMYWNHLLPALKVVENVQANNSSAETEKELFLMTFSKIVDSFINNSDQETMECFQIEAKLKLIEKNIEENSTNIKDIKNKINKNFIKICKKVDSSLEKFISQEKKEQLHGISTSEFKELAFKNRCQAISEIEEIIKYKNELINNSTQKISEIVNLIKIYKNQTVLRKIRNIVELGKLKCHPSAEAWNETPNHKHLEFIQETLKNKEIVLESEGIFKNKKRFLISLACKKHENFQSSLINVLSTFVLRTDKQYVSGQCYRNDKLEMISECEIVSDRKYSDYFNFTTTFHEIEKDTVKGGALSPLLALVDTVDIIRGKQSYNKFLALMGKSLHSLNVNSKVLQEVMLRYKICAIEIDYDAFSDKHTGGVCILYTSHYLLPEINYILDNAHLNLYHYHEYLKQLRVLEESIQKKQQKIFSKNKKSSIINNYKFSSITSYQQSDINLREEESVLSTNPKIFLAFTKKISSSAILQIDEKANSKDKAKEHLGKNFTKLSTEDSHKEQKNFTKEGIYDLELKEDSTIAKYFIKRFKNTPDKKSNNYLPLSEVLHQNDDKLVPIPKIDEKVFIFSKSNFVYVECIEYCLKQDIEQQFNSLGKLNEFSLGTDEIKNWVKVQQFSKIENRNQGDSELKLDNVFEELKNLKNRQTLVCIVIFKSDISPHGWHITLLSFRKIDEKINLLYVDTFGNTEDFGIFIQKEFYFCYNKIADFRGWPKLEKPMIYCENYQGQNECGVHVWRNALLTCELSNENFNIHFLKQKIIEKKLNLKEIITNYRYEMAIRLKNDENFPLTTGIEEIKIKSDLSNISDTNNLKVGKILTNKSGYDEKELSVYKQEKNQNNQPKEQPTNKENLKDDFKQNRSFYFLIIKSYLEKNEVFDQKVLELLAPAIEQAKQKSELFKLQVKGSNLKGRQLVQCYLENHATDEKNELPMAFFETAEYIRDHINKKAPTKVDQKKENDEDSPQGFSSIHSGNYQNKNQTNQNLSRNSQKNDEKQIIFN